MAASAKVCLWDAWGKTMISPKLCVSMPKDSPQADTCRRWRSSWFEGDRSSTLIAALAST